MTRTVRVAFYAMIVAFSCLHVGWLSWTEQHGDQTPDRDSPLARSALADGCYHIYIDGGANIGVHGRFLLEPEKYPDAKEAAGLFDSEFGPPGERDNRDFCVFEIEANPTHLATLTKKENAYKAMGWRYHVINAGVFRGWLPHDIFEGKTGTLLPTMNLILSTFVLARHQRQPRNYVLLQKK